MTEISLLLLWLSVGIMIGSVAAGRFFKVGDLRGNRGFGFMLAGAVFLLGTDKWLVQAGFGHVHAFSVVVLILAGVAGGLFLIPLNAALQAESHQDKLGKTIATQNCLENLAMLASSGFALVNVTAKLDPSQLFFCLAAVVAVVVALLRIPSAKRVKG
jgi:LPLT family lysophospholipid transporter-like MFS transporter